MIDQYSLKARVYPILIAFSPILILGFSISFKLESIYGYLGSISLISLLVYLFSQLGRDLGKKKEKDLWENWGGSPTSIVMCDKNYIDVITRQRYIDKLEIICPAKDKYDIDEKIKLWTKYLISKTRDTKKFNLLFKENISYGFRRNLLGLKSIGVGVAVLATVLNLMLTTNWPLNLNDIKINWVISNFLCLVILLFWCVIVTKVWVKIPAFGYAERLFEAVENMN